MSFTHTDTKTMNCIGWCVFVAYCKISQAKAYLRERERERQSNTVKANVQSVSEDRKVPKVTWRKDKEWTIGHANSCTPIILCRRIYYGKLSSESRDGEFSVLFILGERGKERDRDRDRERESYSFLSFLPLPQCYFYINYASLAEPSKRALIGGCNFHCLVESFGARQIKYQEMNHQCSTCGNSKHTHTECMCMHSFLPWQNVILDLNTQTDTYTGHRKRETERKRKWVRLSPVNGDTHMLFSLVFFPLIPYYIHYNDHYLTTRKERGTPCESLTILIVFIVTVVAHLSVLFLSFFSSSSSSSYTTFAFYSLF